jgi:hypothetical protein
MKSPQNKALEPIGNAARYLWLNFPFGRKND